jgi:hypothetical protein
MKRTLHSLPFAAALLGAACVPAAAPAPAATPTPMNALPPLAVEQTAGIVRSSALAGSALGRATEQGPPVTLTAANVDIRALLPVLAEAAGISLVVGPEVTGRVSVNLREVPARLALETVLSEAGLTLAGESPLTAPWGATVFYAIPFHLDDASAAEIQRRFGVSREIAEWLVASRN